MEERGKGLAALILAGRKPEDESDEKEQDDGDEGSMDEGLLSGAEDMLSAIEEKDPQKLAEALKSFLQMCDDD